MPLPQPIDRVAEAINNAEWLAGASGREVFVELEGPVACLFDATDPDWTPFKAPGFALYPTLEEIVVKAESGGVRRLLITPGGLQLDLLAIPWIWAVHVRDGEYPEYRIGSAAGMLESCWVCKKDTNRVYAVPPEHIHGTCVFEFGARFITETDPYAWGMIQAEGYKVRV